MSVGAEVRRCAVLGSPVAHSLSPVLHRAAHRALGLTGWEYAAVECDEAGLPGLLGSLDGSWVGLSLTMPLKRAVLPLLDTVTPVAASVGAVNTVVLRDGRHGDNTDVPGMAGLLAEALPAAARREAEPVVLGGGATAASTLAALAEVGVRRVRLCVRHPARAAGTARVGAALGLAVQVSPWPEAAELATAPLVVATVPAAAGTGLAAGLGGSAGPVAGLLVDVGYAPWPTPLAAAWAVRGGRVVGGLELLVRQAALQVEAFTGRPVPVEVLRSAGERALAARTG